MASFEMTVEVDRLPGEVFAFISDLSNDPKWRREWGEAKPVTEGPVGVGSSFALYAKVLGRKTEAVYEVTEYQANQVVKWKTVRGPLPLTFWRSVDGVDGSTRVTMGYSGEFPGLLGVFRPLLTRLGKRALKGDLPTLKKVLEAAA